MKPVRLLAIAALVSILPPPAARAQLETLRLVEMPAVGAWAEYQVTRRNQSQRKVLGQRLALVGREVVAGEEYFWFQIEAESDDYGPLRIPVVTQLVLKREDAVSGKDLFAKIHEVVVQVKAGQVPGFRVGRRFLDVGVEKKLLGGGERGAGSEVDYAFRDLEPETLTTPAGTWRCEHKKGIGKGEVVLNPEEGSRYAVDVVNELWYSVEVPFGVVRQSIQQAGAGPETGAFSLTIDSEELTELVACGVGATSAVTGPLVNYDPKLATRLAPAAP